jgi:hypothetical protein
MRYFITGHLYEQFNLKRNSVRKDAGENRKEEGKRRKYVRQEVTKERSLYLVSNFLFHK